MLQERLLEVSQVAPAAPLPDGVPANTRRVYDSAWEAWEVWCNPVDEPPRARAFPARPEDIVAFFTAQRDAGAKLPRLKQLRAAIRRKHHERGHADPCKAAPVMKFWRSLLIDPDVTATRPGKALLYDGIEAIMRALHDEEVEIRKDPSPRRRLALVRDRALILAIFDGALFRAEAAGMEFDQMAFTPGVVRVNVRKSAWNQHREVVYEVKPRDPLLCTYSALCAWRDQGEIIDGPFFRSIDGTGKIGLSPLNAQSIYAIWAQRAGQAGFSASLFPVRALREGAIVEAKLQGRTTHEIVELLDLSPLAEPLLRTRLAHHMRTLGR